MSLVSHLVHMTCPSFMALNFKANLPSTLPSNDLTCFTLDDEVEQYFCSALIQKAKVDLRLLMALVPIISHRRVMLLLCLRKWVSLQL